MKAAKYIAIAYFYLASWDILLIGAINFFMRQIFFPLYKIIVPKNDIFRFYEL